MAQRVKKQLVIWLSTGQGWLMRLKAQLGRENDLKHGRGLGEQ